ncbi:hypothetical protein ACWGIU_04865 [Streptomyces sp. NPDC054840]
MADRPGTPFGPGRRNVMLFADRGYPVLDVVHGRIMCGEARDRPEPGPALDAALTAAADAR